MQASELGVPQLPPDGSERVAILDVSWHEIVNYLFGQQLGFCRRPVGIPADAKVLRSWDEPCLKCYRVLLQSDSFEPVPAGVRPPVIQRYPAADQVAAVILPLAEEGDGAGLRQAAEAVLAEYARLVNSNMLGRDSKLTDLMGRLGLEVCLARSTTMDSMTIELAGDPREGTIVPPVGWRVAKVEGRMVTLEPDGVTASYGGSNAQSS